MINEAIRRDSVAVFLKRALDQTPQVLTTELESVIRCGGDRLLELATGLGLVLVAVDPEGQIVGALLAHPPSGFLSRLVEQGLPWPHMLVAHTAVAKVKALAVAPSARKSGIGGALLRRCSQVYWQCGYLLMFGQFASERQGLGDFYAKQGFTVVPAGAGIDMQVIFGRPVWLHPDGDEQGFFRWRPRS